MRGRGSRCVEEETMTKDEAIKIAKYTAALMLVWVKMEGGNDINITAHIVEDTEFEPGGRVDYLGAHGCKITLYLPPNATNEDVDRVMRHEIAHIICAPYREFFELFCTEFGVVDPERRDFRAFQLAGEIVARRIERILERME